MGFFGAARAPLSSHTPRIRSLRGVRSVYGAPCRVASFGRLRPCGLSTRRLYSFSLKCSGSNIDVGLGQIVTENDVRGDELAIPSGCSIPVVHLKSDILEYEPLNLLEENYLDNLLTTLPVLSEEEQSALAATPAHPTGLYAFYASFLASSLVEQLWNFAWPASVAMVHPNLLAVAVVSFFTKLTVIVGGPLIGNLVDCFPSIPVYNCLSSIQTASQFLSATMIIYALKKVHHTSVSMLLLQPWFVILVVAAGIERLAGMALGVMMERDWVVRLAGTNRSIALAQANATLSRVYLFCEIVGASLFGFLLSKYDPVTCLKFAAGMMICTLPIMVFLGHLTNKLSTGVLDCPKISYGYGKCTSSHPYHSLEDIVKSGIQTIRHGWMEYKQQPVLPASMAHVMLYFNIALVPGAMMTAFLTHQGISPSLIGGFSGLCAFMGIAATFISPSIVKKLGVLEAGATGLILQASFLSAAVAVLWSGFLSQKTSILFFLFLIVLSRLGYMSYDVVGTQILQTGIPSSKANIIGATEVSMASLAEFLMLGVAIIANDISYFGFLATLSAFSVVGATLMFCHWLATTPNEQREAFSYNSQF